MDEYTHTLDCYMDRRGEWRARIVARNGHVIMVTSESYKNIGDLRVAITRVFAAIEYGGLRETVNGE